MSLTHKLLQVTIQPFSPVHVCLGLPNESQQGDQDCLHPLAEFNKTRDLFLRQINQNSFGWKRGAAPREHGESVQGAAALGHFCRSLVSPRWEDAAPWQACCPASVRLQGLHKPVYHQLSDCGDHVVIMNTRHIAFSGNKWEQKVYSSHTGYLGRFKQVTAAQLHRKDPVAIVKLAIYGMLPKNLHRRTLMQRLHLFPDEVSPRRSFIKFLIKYFLILK